ncbi:MAG: DNA polymerase III subunit delta' [Gemmataceae bacterium]
MTWRVRGHDALIAGFRRVVERGRLAHAYLFTGPVGVGKHLFATDLARALLCENPPAPLDPCGECHSCVQVDAGSHPDFHPSARPPEALEFPIELMRSLCASFALKSARGRGKVIVIDGADDLNEESANCFLKTLEEPPPRSVLILIGTRKERQLPTIVSRCQAVNFTPLPPPLVDAILIEQGITDSATRQRLVRLAGGSPGLALTLADPRLWEFRSTLLAGLTGRPVDAVELAKGWTGFVEEAGKESAAQRARAALVLRLVVDFLTDALEVSAGGTPRRTGPEDDRRVRDLAARVDAERLLALLDRCLDADDQITRRVQLVLVLEALLDTFAQRLPA